MSSRNPLVSGAHWWRRKNIVRNPPQVQVQEPFTAEEMLRHMAMPWWQRLGLEFEVRWVFNPAHTTLRKWAWDYRAACERNKGKARVFWPHAWVRVLGLEMGTGLFYMFRKQRCQE